MSPSQSSDESMPDTEFLTGEREILEMPITNSLLPITPQISSNYLKSRRDSTAIFLIYGQNAGLDVGYIFTLKRKSKYSRYECKTCRGKYDCSRRNGSHMNDEDRPAAITIYNGNIHELKKEKQNKQCTVIYLPLTL